MLKLIEKFEKAIITVLILMLFIVIAVSVLELGIVIAKTLLTPPVLLMDINKLLDVLGFFMLILVGIELVETMKVYYTEKSFKVVEAVIMAAIIAITRKIIILDVKVLSSTTLIGISLVLAALCLGYYILRKSVCYNEKTNNED
ncbi:phosphate-starvation-inducible E-like protein [Caloramator sp. E03]|uniref:phosphate-starvation-inducible PsiE family protein n=1 Tax=Caloramator sp. E03 TaxID=2576307 RepID=UPI001110163E|nr:phosphate-starvation-inducible PsiE family protein [Caloramator sp. E03]QCX34202.1 phosphate-starvation-inducible E-like protein [Caloramator sp. E03]